ncbi:ATP-binding cassette sub-family F member 1 [Toxoplasma gondii ME49]|uniref:ATP-binding cassette protein subfamily F member 1 n=4 Tax=Toxoplasma gondii TaxID=5811 RepID=Q4FAB6_TOXGO|nr:ATP-binding cassette sub-family F member 1 [Toxoplasma gondii ME49]AAZ06363.1 ATP-binding cassette sub-family F member 1 [Toxoplasma gondii]EPR58202.1 ATP-binding cassette sub-family F member 1 [Toxoplasma gondii GT1]ACX37106.1 ATP-binding cassette protein subfamily F member 1 [Toxoplasma gondii]ACX37107.1 ATP-binding cassette protein subfamily F member 1 [Toxoplasma gondii]EPT31481.1 ATP-binding cassette sub-family F member 1 [Toxoplasma gondii ME49]|eukprot:XP_002369809.1 ATP-binding cassette sub-family F member 1 [Toxoplasma gondii ME49]
MGQDSESIIDALRTVTCGKVDDGTLEYMAGMLEEEGVARLSVDTACDLIGDFLHDAGVSKNDKETRAVCEKLLSLLRKDAAPRDNAAGGPSEQTQGGNSTDDLDGSGVKRADGEGSLSKPRDFATPMKLGDMAGHSGRSFDDPFLGLHQNSAKVNYNAPVLYGTDPEGAAAAAAAAQQQQRLQQQRERHLRQLKEWEKNKPPLPPPKRKHGDKQLKKMGEGILVDSFSIAVAGRELLIDAQLKLVKGRRYGLVGRNGIGKSTLLSALVRQEIHGVDPDIAIGMVEQEHLWGSETVLDAVLAVDEDRLRLLEEEQVLLKQEDQSEKVGRRLGVIYERLQEIDAANAEKTAATILRGLGFTESMQHMKVTALSGGWRMRVLLARCLFSDPDVLLLDEPTNHLDLEAVQWLTNYLSVSEGPVDGQTMRCGKDKIVIVVSHAREFLNDVCTDMIHFTNQNLTYYKGDFDTFESVRAAQLLQQQRQAEAQQAKIKHVQSFIDKFRYNAKRASLVQSRIKLLSKLPMLDMVAEDPSLHFNFKEPEVLAAPLLQAEEVSFSYAPRKSDEESEGAAEDAETDDAEPTAGASPSEKADENARGKEGGKLIVRGLNLNVDMDSRIALCGVNGSGKSTILKLLVGSEQPTKGMVHRNGKLRIGYFTQQHVDQLDLTLNAVQSLQMRYPEAGLKDEAARTYLGQFGISGLLALEPLYILSGGQKSRVAIALMAFNNPHILILDEPTNHLDLDAVQALIAALNNFKGGVLLVSHDSHLLSCVVEEIFYMDEQAHKLQKYHGDFLKYRKELLKRAKTAAAAQANH